MTYSNDLDLTRKALDTYLENCLKRKNPVVKQLPMATLADDLAIEDLIKSGGLHGKRLTGFLDTYLDNLHQVQHPASMGHQVASPHLSGALGGFIDAVTNNPMAIYEMGPAAATIEYALINWMLKKVGWTPSPYPGEKGQNSNFGAGVLTHGGSLAQLTAFTAARSHADPDIWVNGNNPALVVIAPPDAHYSASRALGILGMGQKSLIPAPCDEQGSIIPEQLEETILAAKKSGKKIMAVVANAGCTAAGLYDDLTQIGALCQSHKVWLHVDGAHGASALLSAKYKHLLNGIEQASSIIWDAHKMMRTPGLCAAVLVKDHKHIDQAFTQEASYLFHDKEQAGFDAISRSVECTKAGIGLKFFMGLAAEGEQGLAAYVDSRYDLAQQAANHITTHPKFELAVQPEANIVCFRVKGLDDKQHLELRKILLASGESYITTTNFMGKRWLRFTFMNPETCMEDIEHTLGLLLEISAKQ
jgi:L-2,4-diaminobutyrate decarboxylase